MWIRKIYENSFYHDNDLFQAGIDSGYQEKPCLNPHDPNCPRSAPNKYSKQVEQFFVILRGKKITQQ